MKKWIPIAIVVLVLPMALAAQQQATLLGTWSDPSLVGSNAYNNTYNEIWGVAVNGHEYAVIGSTAGTHFIDVTDPTAPFEAYLAPGAVQGGTIVHRDYHDYKGYLYAVCDEGPSTLQIMDLSQLPDTVRVVYDYGTQITRSHNIFIDTATAKLYTFATNGGPAGYSAMRIYDLTDPLDPEYIGKYNNFGGLIAGHVHDGYVRNDVAFLNCGGNGFAMVDFSDPQTPVTISTITDYPYRGYNHSGWLSDDARYYYMSDENHGYQMKVVDVSDPCEPQVAGTFDAGVANPWSIAHNQIVACNYLYVSYYYEGLAVFDISDPANPQKVLYYDTSTEPNGQNYKGAWGVYPFLPSGIILISDMQEGLFVFQGVGDNCAATETLTPVDLSCLGVSSSSEQAGAIGLEVFPQPVHQELNVRLTLAEGQSKVNACLMDITGREVQRLGTENLGQGENTLHYRLREGLQPGMYLLHLQGEGLNVVKRVVVW
ncbi:MAG: choice-of-anchor B family protein [Phaeodactylibacter sp.]|nr:choice-of-anchor B family protein [Phaeodactylibacter sp.]MCB9299238.1 choice-of-anchor B family protein [Lewinellaceae bacterium]